jgi:hypothetical protein
MFSQRLPRSGGCELLTRITVAIIATAPSTITTVKAQQQLTPEQQTIMRTTMNADGWLTADEHRRFWAPILPRLQDPEAVAAWRRMMDQFIGLSVTFQLETWKSLQLSEREGRVVKTAGYDDAKRAVLAAPLIGAQSAPAIQNAEGMLQAAASKSAFSTPGGAIYLSADMIERTLSGIEGSFCRMRRLSEPEWKDRPTEYKYPAAHVYILNDCPLAVEQSQIATEQGVTAKMVTLGYGVSNHARIQIAFTPLRGRWVDPVASLTRVARSTLRGMGITDTQPIVETWRNYRTAMASGSAKLSEGSIGASVRVIEGLEAQGNWILMAISSQSQLEAQALRGELEDRVLLK